MFLLFKGSIDKRGILKYNVYMDTMTQLKYLKKFYVTIRPDSSVNGKVGQTGTISLKEILSDFSRKVMESGIPAVVKFVFLDTMDIAYQEHNIICRYEIPLFPAQLQVEEGTLSFLESKYKILEQINDIMFKYFKIMDSAVVKDEGYKFEVVENRNLLIDMFDQLSDTSLYAALPENLVRQDKIKQKYEDVEKKSERFFNNLSSLGFSKDDYNEIFNKCWEFFDLADKKVTINKNFLNNNAHLPEPLAINLLEPQKKRQAEKAIDNQAELYTNYILFLLAQKENNLRECNNPIIADLLKNLKIGDSKDKNGNPIPHSDVIFKSKFIEERYRDLAPQVEYIRELLELYVRNLKNSGGPQPFSY